MTGNHEDQRRLHLGTPIDLMLLAVPLGFAIYLIPAWKNDTLLFFVAGIAIIPLAAWLGRATEQLAERSGPGIGGLLNATLGNAPELILSLVALSKGLTVIVKASITGSIIGNILLILGVAMLTGGMRFPRQRFNQTGIRGAATSLSLAVIGLIIPTIFHATTGWHRIGLSAVAIVLFATYVLWLVFSLITHKDLFAGENLPDDEVSIQKEAPWSVPKAFTILAAAAILIAVMSEFLASSVEAACRSLHLSEMFVGVIVVAIVANAGESTAVMFSLKNKMNLSLGITIGSTLQVALFITPILVFASYVFGSPMTLEFSLPEVAAVALAVGIFVLISGDGECNWLEGVQLIAVYAIIALFFFYLPEAASG
jgi:Ca2+:H+ antiporter